MAILTEKAQRQVDALIGYYEDENRLGALRNLRTAIAAASDEIDRNPGGGKPAPTPFPDLALPDRAWIKSGRYWFLYSTTEPLVIISIFFETSDIPNRL